MNENQGLTAAIVEAVLKSVTERGLHLEPEIPPASPGYSKEWAIQDGEGWSYAGFGILIDGRYEYTLALATSIPGEDAQTTIDWLQAEIIRIFERERSNLSQ